MPKFKVSLSRYFLVSETQTVEVDATSAVQASGLAVDAYSDKDWVRGENSAWSLPCVDAAEKDED